MDFFDISIKSRRNGIEIAPVFHVKRSDDLMTRGKDFYAVWDEETGLWSTDEFRVADMVDKELWAKYEAVKKGSESTIKVLAMRDFDSGSWEKYRRFITKSPDNYKPLDNKLTFANDRPKKTDYSSRRLPYSLSDGECPNWYELVSTLYEPLERRKIEWAIGSIIAGDAKYIQKFLVFYGDAGSGKSTVLNIIQKLFDGYYCTFDSKALGSSSNQFSLEPFKNNPLVAIQHDGDLSRIDDNSRLNSIVSHEEIIVNEKRKSMYTMRMNPMLLMATNKPVKITDGKSGLIRRLIDVNPSGNLIPSDRYQELLDGIDFEVGAIASRCLRVYNKCGKHFYDRYRSTEMRYKTDVFFNFVDENYFVFSTQEGITLKQAYAMYKEYCSDTSLSYMMPMYAFREELKNYFDIFDSRCTINGEQYRSYYRGFKADKFDAYASVKSLDKDGNNEGSDGVGNFILLESDDETSDSENVSDKLIDNGDKLIDIPVLNSTVSIFDSVCADCKAQYASDEGRPFKKWINVETTLKELDTSRVHYVQIPPDHIVIDFDLKDPITGEKSAELNLKAAGAFPKTYTEFSKSGAGVHLHYIYDGDSSSLSRLYAEGIEVKVFSGNSSLRRKLTFCNEEPIAHISGGLPLKEKKVVSDKQIKSEKGLRDLIIRNLHKEIHSATKPSIDFIYKILDEAYNSGMTYDVDDLSGPVLAFAANSTNQAAYCIKTVGQMHFKSKDMDEELTEQSNTVSKVSWIDKNGVEIPVERFSEEEPLVFFDIEVFPNLLLVNYKKDGEGETIHRLINPKPHEIESLFKMKLVGYNNRRYDNHILYGCWLGRTNEELYHQSKAIIFGTKEEQKAAMYSAAYNLSYTDVYDFASAPNKMSLKKAEIEMGIHHLELGMDWDKPVPESEWEKVSEYCDNDVLATEARFHWLNGDWTARCILADLTGMSVNDSTNALSTRFIFEDNKHPQNEFNYRDLGKPIQRNEIDDRTYKFIAESAPEMLEVKHPVLDGKDYDITYAESVLPYFPGYKFEWAKKTVAGKTINTPKSTYRGEEVGEGGYVYAEPGIYTDVALLDITSMHPTSTIDECLFGPKYTEAFRDIVYSRVAIKHENWDAVSSLLDGKLIQYVEKVKNGELTSGDLAGAMKTIINSVYGLTSARFPNSFKDNRNVDNIVAKRGALFMVDLKHAVQEQGYIVAHIKTDSIKIPNVTPSIIQFVMDFGKKYGYNFEHEATYEKMCLVNKAVYVAKYKDGNHTFKLSTGEKIQTPWTATGAQFQQPYVFKMLFSDSPVTFEDMCETKNVKTALYLDMNEGYPLHSYTQEEYDKEIERIINDAVKKNQQKINNDSNPDKKKQEVIDAALKRYKGPKVGDLVNSHNYVFVGRAGQFCPIKEGFGGGELVREQDGKFVSATDASDYRWLESEMVRRLNMENAIDTDYYRAKIDEAVASIEEYGDFNWFTSDDGDNKISIP